jgi:hypothetical protein
MEQGYRIRKGKKTYADCSKSIFVIAFPTPPIPEEHDEEPMEVENHLPPSTNSAFHFSTSAPT